MCTPYGLKKTRAYISKTKNRKLAANERDLLAKHYYSKAAKLHRKEEEEEEEEEEEGAVAMRANQ